MRSRNNDTRAGAAQRARWTLCLSSYAPKAFTMSGCDEVTWVGEGGSGGARQVNAVLVLVRAEDLHDVGVPLQVVHDLHLPPHVLHILRRPARRPPHPRHLPRCNPARLAGRRGPHAPCAMNAARSARHQTQDRNVPRDAQVSSPAAAVYCCAHHLQPYHALSDRASNHLRALLSNAADSGRAAHGAHTHASSKYSRARGRAAGTAPDRAPTTGRREAALRMAGTAGGAAGRARTAACACRWTCTRTPGRSPCAPQGAWCQTARARARGPGCTLCTHPARA